MVADLHVHTTASDGRYTPEEVWAQATRAGLGHLAITDHDTLDGFLALVGRTAGGPVLIPGIEFSTDLPACEVHILGYIFNPADAELNRQLALIAGDRLTRAERMVAKLADLGYPVAYDRVLAIAGASSSVGRPHVAHALVEEGYFPDVAAVFDTVLERGKPGYVPHYKLTPAGTVALIKNAGGLAVLAHPGLVGDDAVVRAMLELGIDGIEAYHPSHDKEATARYLAMADEYGLAVTGGSDFHGIPGRFPETLGEFVVPGDLAVHLLKRPVQA
ncbi:PHP domain-containing protein [Anaeroselena agilis]|uniref:PHP domain-containing protein n=1 Tax=Anaeroselena agilis TaxID=3063788 RepID=A0ABU3NX39_9FIRM|nr:PHP domain-containing protein [Selenomonadales bacterium 4137-cl]